jgi:ureidoacrylate peracid hydrolase
MESEKTPASLVSHNAQGASMTPDTFSEQRMPAPPLALDLTRTAVIVVDMVNEFFEPGGKMVLEGGMVLYAPVNALLDAAHQAHLPVFYTNQWLRPDDALFKKRIPHCLMDTWGAQLVDALHRAPDDIVVPKRRYSAFFGTDLDLHLRERTIATVIVVGVVTNICVRSTVHDAFFLGYEVVVPLECVTATSPQAQDTSLYDIATHYGMVAPLDQVLHRLRVLETARTS